MKLNNRFIFGILSLLLAAVIAFVALPTIARQTNGKEEIVRITQPVLKGEQISSENAEVVEVGGYNLPSNIAHQLSDVNGLYATADLAVGDYILTSKISSVPVSSDVALNSIPSGKVAISLTVKTLASGLSDKLQPGDIIRIYHFLDTAAEVPELRFVKVLSVTDSDGINVDNAKEPTEDEEKQQSATITVLASPEQAKIITGLENDGVAHVALPRVFAQEDETARRIAQRLVTQMPVEHIAPVLEQVKVEMGLRLSAQQEAAVYAAFRHGLSVITGSPGTGKTTVLRTILEVYRRLHPDGKIALMAPTGRASRRMSESTGFEDARTLHSGLGLTSEEDEGSRNRKSEPLSADLIIVDEFSMVDMWLAEKFFERMKANARIVLVGDPDQLPSVGAGNVFREIIETQIVPVTVLDQIFRQSKDSLIAYNAKFINEGNTKLFYGPDFVFVSGDSQEDTAEKITERYCLEIQESGIENVQILSPFRSEGAASSEQLNETIRELVNPFRSAEEEIKFGPRIFRVNDRIMQTKNTEKVSNGDLGFIRYIKDTDQGKKIGMDFGAGRTLEYGVDDLSNVDLAYATTIHKAMGSEYETVIMPLLKAHTIMMYRNLPEMYHAGWDIESGFLFAGASSPEWE